MGTEQTTQTASVDSLVLNVLILTSIVLNYEASHHSESIQKGTEKLTQISLRSQA